jgi:hypothetical protein
MHSSPSQSLTNSDLFETPPNHTTKHSSTTTILWSKITVATPSPPCPLAFLKKEEVIYARLMFNTKIRGQQPSFSGKALP